MPTIRVADFSPSPGGRYKSHGPFSGEEYRDRILIPALERAVSSGEMLHIELDGTSGYGSSFLEEAFGGLIRLRAFDPQTIRAHLSVVARSELYAPYALLARRYIDAAERKLMTA